MYRRIRAAREKAGYTREQFAELVNVSVSYMAEVERGRCNVSLKTLVVICNCLGLSADYLLFGESSDDETRLADKIHRLDPKYYPMINSMVNELLAIEVMAHSQE